MHIAFLGSGPVAVQLAARFAVARHTSTLGRRTPPVTFSDAVNNADVIIIAIPFRACAATLPAFADAFAGKVVVDATNPLNEDYSPIAIDGGRSAAEFIQALLPKSRIVKAYNTIFADAMSEPHRDGTPVAAFICGDDAEANATVSALSADAGYDPIVIPSLAVARHLEATAHLNIAIAFRAGRGTRGAFAYLP